MKKNFLSVLLIILLMTGMLFGLTACGDKDDEQTSSSSRESKSSKSEDESFVEKTVENVIKEYEDALNKQDLNKLMSLLDLDEINDDLDANLNEDDIKSFLDNIESYKITKSYKIESKDDLENATDETIADDTWEDYEEYLDKNHTMYFLDAKINGEKVNDALVLNKENKVVVCTFVVYLKASQIAQVSADQMTKMEIMTFNSTFTKYEGNAQTASNVKVLLNDTISINMSNPDKTVTVEFDGEKYTESSEISSLRSKISNDKKYSISFDYDKTGFVTTIIISEDN